MLLNKKPLALSVLAIAAAVLAAVPFVPLKGCLASARVFPGASFADDRIGLAHNSPEVIRRELLDPDTLCHIANSLGIGGYGLGGVALEESAGRIVVFQTRLYGSAFPEVSAALRDYAQARESGHTRGYVRAAFESRRIPPESIADSDLRALAVSREAELRRKDDDASRANRIWGRLDLLPLTGLAKEHQLEWNSVDKIRRRSVTFRIADGDLAWGYQMEMKDGIVDSCPVGSLRRQRFRPAVPQSDGGSGFPRGGRDEKGGGHRIRFLPCLLASEKGEAEGARHRVEISFGAQSRYLLRLIFIAAWICRKGTQKFAMNHG